MKRGILARVDGTLGRLGDVVTTREEDGQELTDIIEVTSVKRTPDGLDITAGRAATQELTTTDSVSISNRSISVSSDATVETKLTEFIAVGDEFVAVDSSAGTFAFDLLSDHVDATISRANVNLDDFWVSLNDATPWKVGFYGHDGPVENGVVHGESVLDDGVFGNAIADLQKNQLGVRTEIEGEEYKFMLTSSGYLDLYRPTEIESSGFATFISDRVLPYTALDV